MRSGMNSEPNNDTESERNDRANSHYRPGQSSPLNRFSSPSELVSSQESHGKKQHKWIDLRLIQVFV